MDNYVVYHLHSDLSSGVTNIDSVTKFQQYIERAKECGMRAMGFSEHGSVFEWWHKKCAIEAAGMKYLHGVEAYLTETLDEKVRDNMHCVLVARNYDGFLELNNLISRSFNRNDNHFYYVPRIALSELFGTSNNIIVTSACIGGVFGKGNEQCQEQMLSFMRDNSERCFLEIGHHADDKQVSYNGQLLELANATGIRLIAGTDTHVLNERHEKGRRILQASKNIHFDGEERWDLKFHDLHGLLEAYESQRSVPETVYLNAIDNTNVLADMVEPFEIDCNTKYPHIYDNPVETFRQKVYASLDKHPYASKRHTRDELVDRIEEELAVYQKTKSEDFMLLETYMREWEHSQGIVCGPGRGSVSGSMVAYLLGVTDMDSMRFNLNFFRFMNPDRVTNADIDTDYSGPDRERVKQFLLRDRMNLPKIRTSEIITFNTIALKGAIRDVGRALEIPLATVSQICQQIDGDEIPEKLRNEYPELFEYVDIVNGTIVSVGTHPSGVLVSDLDIDSLIGTCSIGSSDYPVSMLNMRELDDQMWVKLDVLGLDNWGIILDTCRLAGIERLTPDTTDFEDMDVWRSIRDDTTCIFQWESNSSQAYLRQFMSDKTIEIAKKRIPNFSMLDWLSFGNGLIRPACASFRDNVARGEFYDNGLAELNEFLAPEAGRIAMQETIMKLLVRFCGYNNAESDSVRRAIAKKKGTESLLPEIRTRFIEYTSTHYDISAERCSEIVDPLIQVILDASSYAFSWNHSGPYSAIGYMCGYLRYYYPFEFLTAALNTFSDNIEKTAAIIRYARGVGIRVTPPKFGVSGSGYSFDKEHSVIAKGMSSVKHIGAKLADRIQEVSHSREFRYFSDLLDALKRETPIDSQQLSTLIHIDFFSMFGNQRELEKIVSFWEFFKRGTAKQVKKEAIAGSYIDEIVRRHSNGLKKDGTEASSYTLNDIPAILRECEEKVLSLGLNDYGVITKARYFNEAMGYSGYISGRDEDRSILFVKDVFPVKRKRDGKQFGYNVITQSVGSGIESRFTVFNRVFNAAPIKKGNVIRCQKYRRDPGGYFTLEQYCFYDEDESTTNQSGAIAAP